MTKNIIPGGLFLAFSLFFIYWGTKISPSPYSSSVIGPRVFPIAIGVALSIASIVLIIKGFIEYQNMKQHNNGNEEENLEEKMDRKKLFIILVMLVGYIILFLPLGYILSTGLFILILMMYLDRKHWIRNIIYAIAFPVIVFVLFNNILSVYLPMGPFG